MSEDEGDSNPNWGSRYHRFINPRMSLMRSWIKCGHYLCFRRAHEMSTPDHWGKHGEELLRFAVTLHSPETMRQLLKIVDPCLLSNGDIGRIIFSECAQYLPDVGCLEAIVRAGTDLDRDFGNGERALHVFVQNVQMKRWSKFDRAVELLCQHGANINQEDGNGRTVLEELCHRLINSNMHSLDNLQSKSNLLGERLMHESSSKQDKLGTQMVKALLHNGACLPRLGCGQLHALLRQSCSSIVQTFVKHGMDPRVQDEEGQPLLTLAVRLGDADLVDCLWTHGCTGPWKAVTIPYGKVDVPMTRQPSKSAVRETSHRQHNDSPQLKKATMAPSPRSSDGEVPAVGGAHREACLAWRKDSRHLRVTSKPSAFQPRAQCAVILNSPQGRTLSGELRGEGTSNPNGGYRSRYHRFINPGLKLMQSWLTSGHYICFQRAHEMSTPDHWEKHGEALLRFVATLHSPETMRQLLKMVDPRLLSNGDGGRVLLSECARYLPDLSCLEAIVRVGIDLDRDFGNGERALHVFVKNVETKGMSEFDRAVELLCQHGANINQEDGNGRTVLEELCQRLIRSGTRSSDDLRSKANQLDERLVHESLPKRDELEAQMIMGLLHNGACLPRLGSGQLHALVRHCSSVVKTLVKHGMDPYVLDEEGQPLLTLAVRLGDADLVDCLWTHGHTSYWKGSSIPNCIMGVPSQSAICETNPRKHIIGPQLKEIAREPSVHVSDRKTAAVGNAHKEACLACFSTGKVLLHKPLLMNDVVKKAVRENKPGVVKALYDYGAIASAPSTHFQITKGEAGSTLQCLLCLGKWKTSNVHRSLLLHSSLCLMEAYTLDQNLLDKRPDVFMIQERDNLLAFATESFKQSLDVRKRVEEARKRNRTSCKAETINIAGNCITEAKDLAEFQKLLSTTIPSKLKELSAIHLHGLLVMERLGDSRCELYFSTIYDQLWGQYDWSSFIRSANVAGALACYDFLLHHMQGALQRPRCLYLYTPRHHIRCAKKVGHLLQWLSTKLSPGHRISVSPVLHWLISVAVLPLFKRRMEFLFIAGTIFGLSEMISTHELDSSVKRLSDLAVGRGKQWNILFVMLQLKTDLFIKQNLPSYNLETSLRMVQSFSLATTDTRMAAMASTLLNLGMTLPDLEGDHLFQYLLGQPQLLQVCFSHGLDIWQKDSTGTPLVCRTLAADLKLDSSRLDVLHILVGGITNELPSNDSYELAESAYSQQLQDYGGNQWDLWLLAIERQSICSALVLHEHKLPARQEALLSAAVHESEEIFELLLMVRTWCSTDLMDAYNLRSAHHLHKWLKHCSGRYLVDPAERFEKYQSEKFCSIVFPMALFEKSLHFKACGTDGNAEVLCTTKRCAGAGFEFYEANTKDNLLELAEKPVHVDVYEVNHAHVHGLLVMQRLLSRHAKCFEYFLVLFEKLTGESKKENLKNQCSPLSEEDMLPVMACFQLIQNFLHVSQQSSDFEKFDFPGSALCLALTISTRLLQSNVLIDVSEVFQAVAHTLVLWPQSLGHPCDMQHLMTQVCILLLAMGRQRVSQSALKSLEAAVQLMVKACSQSCATIATFLHHLVWVWTRNAKPFSGFNSASSAEVILCDFSNVMFLVKEFLDAGADPNALDRWGKMAAHYVIENLYRSKQVSPFEEGASLLTLFDEYGLHWDAFGGESEPLYRRIIESWDWGTFKFPCINSLVRRLTSKPRSLQCIAAQVAAQAHLNYSFLPKGIQQFIELHKPQGTTINREFGDPLLPCGSHRCCNRLRRGWGFRFAYRDG